MTGSRCRAVGGFGRVLFAGVATVAVVAAGVLPAGADAPFRPSPVLAQAEDGEELTVGSDGALWSVERTDPVVLRRTAPDGTRTSVTLPHTGAVLDVAPGIGGDAVWVAVHGQVIRVGPGGRITTVTMPREPDRVEDLSLEPSANGDRMWFVGRLVEVASGRTRSAVGTIDAAGQVVLKPVRTSFGAEPVAGPQGTRWTVVEGGLGRIEDDLTVTTVPVGGAIPGPLPGLVLGSDGLLWVHVVRPDGPVIARVRADGSIASTVPLPEHGPVPPSFGVVGPDGAAYFGVARGFLRVSTDGQVRLVLKTGKTRPTDGPGESVVFAGRIHHLVRFGCCYGGYDYGDWREPGRLDLDGRAFPVVTGRALGPVVPEGSVTIEVQVAGDRGTPGGTVTVVDHTYFTHHGFGGDSYAPVGTADLDAGGRARVTVPVSRFSVGFHVDYPGSSTYHGTTSLDVRYERDTRSETERYVSQVYRDLLRREPEPAGMQYWTATLNRGTPRTAVAHALAISTEHRERFVDGLFRRYLGRDADRAGRDSFVADLARGATMNQIRASILGSQEYFVRRGGGTVDGFISALYQQVLDRQPDAQGRAFWRTELARGVSEPTVASALLASQEAQRRLVDGHFQDLLRRSVDSGGRDYWVSLLQRGFREERLIAELIGSQEYYGRAVAGTYG